jgi:NTE family protein
MGWPIRLCVALFGTVLATAYAVAQDSPAMNTTKRPKIGLVLEGGGALGLAHIGVIQWLEEHRIPVSYVAGTSMGGLVGGLYATGRSAAEIRQVVQTIDWDEVLRGQTPFLDLAFRRKQDAHDYPSSLEFGLRKGLHFPAGFNSGQQVSLILDSISLPYSELKSFDDLPIPFACVATDLQSGKEYVFRSGPLALALRSTMSLPGVFTPVRSGDHVYADGGLLNNIPISIAKEMGADLTLGIHLEVAPLDPEKPLSGYVVLRRSISVVVAANELRSMEQADLLVTVPLQKYTATDYDQADAIIKAGYEAAAAKASVLSAFSVDEATWNQYLASRNARRRQAPVPEFVEVTGTDPKLAGAIERDMSSVLGEPVDTSKLDDEIMTLSGMGRFLNLNYSMVDRNGLQGLQIQTDPKPYMPPVVRPLILIDGSDYNNVLFSIGARITFLDLGGFRSELRNDVIVGSQDGIASEYYRPFKTTSQWFVAPRLGFYSAQYNVYSGTNLIADYRRSEAGGGVDVGYEFGRSGELRLGYEGGYERLSQQIGSPTALPTVSGGTGDVRLQYLLDELDQPVIPRSGRTLKVDTNWFNANPAAPEGFPLSEIQSENVFRLSGPSSIYFNAYGGTSFGYKAGIPAFSLGGTQRLVAYGTNELLTDQYFLLQLGYIRQLLKLPPLGDTLDFIGMYELGKTYQLPNGPKPPELPNDIVSALVVNTIFGPVEVGGAIGNYGRGKFFFRIGRIF